jgi:hypothetical protein
MTSRITRLHEFHFRSGPDSARPSSPQAEWVPPPAVSSLALVTIIVLASLTLAMAANFGLRPVLSEGPPAALLGTYWQADAEAMSARPLQADMALSLLGTGAAKPSAANMNAGQLLEPDTRAPTANGRDELP